MISGRRPSGRSPVFFWKGGDLGDHGVFCATWLGAGKTCVLSLIAQKEISRIKKGKSPYKQVFTNYPCVGTFRIKVNNLADKYVHDSLIILDEVTMELDSRSWKDVQRGLVDYIVTHRHVNCDIVYAVQDWSR